MPRIPAPEPEPAAATAPAASLTPPPEPSLSQATPAPDAQPASTVTRLDLPPLPQAPQTAILSIPASQSPQATARLAAPTPQIPAPSLAHIPALVIKFAPAKVFFGAVNSTFKEDVTIHRLLREGLPRGRQALAGQRAGLAGDGLSRNCIWGHPILLRYIERFAKDAKERHGWPGLLVGDMSMPRGGPMPFGHASHQVGLDVDIWYKPMPDRVLSDEEREKMPMETFLLIRGT